MAQSTTTTSTWGPSAEPPAVPVRAGGRPETRPARFPCFDGLRAIAAVSVLVYHAGAWSFYTELSAPGIYVARLDIGVSVFFIISGFLLYRPFVVAHLSGRPAPTIGRFWLRRLLRIVPAYWLALTVIAYGFHTVVPGSSWRGVAADYGFAQIYFPSYYFTGLGQAWSLCTEMSFYLFLPLYAATISLRRRSGARQLAREVAGLVALIAAGLVFRYWVFSYAFQHTCPPRHALQCLAHPHLVVYMNTWLPSYIPLFAVGMALAVASAWYTGSGSEPAWLGHRSLPWVSWAGAAVIFWGVSHVGAGTSPDLTPGQSTEKDVLYACFALLLALPAVFGPRDQGLVRRLLMSWPLAALGVVSYGVYLWHIAWINELLKISSVRTWEGVFTFPAMVAIVLTCSIASAAGSYFVLERPLLHFDESVAWLRRFGSGRWGRANP